MPRGHDRGPARSHRACSTPWPRACSRPTTMTAIRPIVDALYHGDWFMVAADFDAYATAQREVDRLWRPDEGLDGKGNPQYGEHGLVLVRPDDPRICPRDLERSHQPEELRTVWPNPDWKTDDAEVEAIVAGRHDDPFAVLGLHRKAGKLGRARLRSRRRRASRPSTPTASPSAASIGATPRASSKARSRSRTASPCATCAANAAGDWTVIDAYLFGPVLGPLDDYYIGRGQSPPPLRQAGRASDPSRRP